MQKKNFFSSFLFILITTLSISRVHASPPDLLPLQHAWAKANYKLEGEAQLEAFSTLIAQAKVLVEQSENSAEALTWVG